MTAAAALLADVRSLGIELETDGVRIRWRPAFMVAAPLAAKLRSHKRELIELLMMPDSFDRCPTCRWPLDSIRRCPKCFDRLCVECGRPTGSYLIRCCGACSHRAEGNDGNLEG